jgi:glutathione S-transferase
MLTEFPLTTLALVLALVVFFVLAAGVGAARAKYNVPAPLSSGHPEFDKRYRVQMNTLEQLLLFVPGMLLAGPVLGDMATAAFGLVWSLGRIIYAVTYVRDPAKRSAGFMLTLLPSVVLLGAAVWGAVRSLM